MVKNKIRTVQKNANGRRALPPVMLISKAAVVSRLVRVAPNISMSNVHVV